MDLKILFTACTLILAFNSVGNALPGGVTDGGGNVQKSTRADLEIVISHWDRYIQEITDNGLFGESFEITKIPLNKELQEITQSVMGKSYFSIGDNLATYMRKLQFSILDGPCLDNGKEKDASTKYRQNSPVCLSATRLARFPRTSLRLVLLPLVLHEVAHQFGWNEKQAQEIQDLTEIHLKFRPIYLAAYRARGACAYTSRVSLTKAQKKEAYGSDADLPVLNADRRELVLLQCIHHATSAGEALRQMNDGDLFQALSVTGFTADEIAVLNSNFGRTQFSFVTMTDALLKPSSQSSCPTCDQFKVDQSYILMLGARVAIQYISQEVGRLQSLIP